MTQRILLPYQIGKITDLRQARTKSASMRQILYWTILLGLLVWTADCYFQAHTILSNLETDLSGNVAYGYAASVGMGGDEHAFLLDWQSNPQARQAFIASFESTFIGARLQNWLWPTLGIGMLALLIRFIPGTPKQDGPPLQM